MDTTTPHPQPTVADGWTRKRRYHHGNLAPSALARGRQIVALQQAAGRWVAFAATHANLYRLVSGEGWHAPGSAVRGLHGMLTVASPRRALETALGARRDPDRATYLASAIHGLALARIDGLTGPDTERALARALRVPRG